MPRPNKPRDVPHEAHLARRIRAEREKRDLTYERLAEKMTEAGCSLQGSAIYKIENGDPPRRITVNEAMTFAQVFGVPLTTLMVPADIAASREATKLWRRIDEVNEKLLALQKEYRNLSDRLLHLVDEDATNAVREAIRSAHGDEALEWIDHERVMKRFNSRFGASEER